MSFPGSAEAPQQAHEFDTVTGSIAGIITKKPDTWQIEISIPGSQYTKKLWTKDNALVTEAASRIGQSFTFVCRVTHWTMADGKPVRSMWIDQIQPVGENAPVIGTAQSAPQSQGDKDMIITWLALAKEGPAVLWENLPEDQKTVSNYISLIDYFTHVAFERQQHGIPRSGVSTGNSTPASSTEAAQGSFPGGDDYYENTPPPPDDDGIPF